MCHAHCSRIYPYFCLLSWFHNYPIWLLLVFSFPHIVPSHSCDPLEDLFPSSSQHGFSSAFLEEEDLEFWQWYPRFHFHHWWIPLLQLSDWQSVESAPCSTSTYIYSHGLDCTGSLGLFMKTLVPCLWTKLRRIMFYLCTQLPDLLKTHHYCIWWLWSTFVIYVVLYPYHMMHSNIVKELVFQ